MSKVYIEKIGSSGMGVSDVKNALEWLNWEDIIQSQSRVFIKPNLTYPQHIPGVTTTPKAIEAIVAAITERTTNIIVGEANGGYHSFQAEEGFYGHNLYEIQKKYGIGVVNLSKEVEVKTVMVIGGREVEVNLPQLLIEEVDVFITLPVPKIHLNTGVSLAFKNQWGCIPSAMRLKEHYEFTRKIVAINKILKPKLAIMDGTYFLNRMGPMSGDEIRMDLLIAGDDAGATNLVVCELMGIDPMTIRHFRMAKKEKMFPESIEGILLNKTVEEFKGQKFYLRRAFLDWVTFLGFNSKFFTWLFWDSFAADPLHKLLFWVRKNRFISYLLYGKVGFPPEWTPKGD